MSWNKCQALCQARLGLAAFKQAGCTVQASGALGAISRIAPPFPNLFSVDFRFPQDAVDKGHEHKSSYLLLALGVVVHESLSLVLTPLAAPLMTHQALM